ncbi:MAG: biopolymer transporter Tol [Ignavibacteria bacterium]|nr:biopolymer transporter Tol [Ignavibacteria bacterium]
MKKFITLLILFLSIKTYSQFEPHPDVDWYTIETENFNITFHKGTERSAKLTAKIAEEIYAPVTSLYNYKPDTKTNIIVNDLSDISNGATDFFNNRIEIFSSALDFEFRGTHNWLRNVITHEFTHMVQLQASMKFSRKVPAIYLQWLNYEKERRPDVLYGYPNAIVSYPISGINVPAWFAEGTAQYQRQQLAYDKWDSQRDMILRMYIEDNNMLSYNEMGQFSSITSLKAESIYNSGYALVRYISEKYGEDKLKEITEGLSRVFNFSMDAALKKTIGKSGDELYNEWIDYLKKDYSLRLKGVKETKISGTLIETEGFANYSPKYSPDGKKIAYLTNKGYDFGLTRIVIYDRITDKKEELEFPVSYYSWAPNNEKIIFSERNIPPKLDGITIFDLYEYDLKTKEITKLTENKRATSPSYSPDGKQIVYLVNKDGTINIEIADNKAKNPKRLTDFKNGEQLYNPKFSPDGKFIFFEYSLEEARKIAYIDLETKNFYFILNEPNVDYRNPELSKDGKYLFFSSDKTGIFNIYKYDLETKEIKQITNVIGGAFMPSIDSNDNLVYASYYSSGFKIEELKNISAYQDKEIKNYIPPSRLVEKYANADSTNKNDKFDWRKLRNYDDKIYKDYTYNNYKPIFNQLSLFPVIRFDNYTKDNNILDAIKPGLYFYSDELMTRFSIFGGAFINRKAERDIFLQFTYNNGFPIGKDFLIKKFGFSPKLIFEGYNVTRKADAQVIAGLDSIKIGVEYNLLAFILGLEFHLFNNDHLLRFEYGYNKYQSNIDPFLIPSSGISVRGSSQDYFKAHSFSFIYNYTSYARNRNSDINPIGRKVDLRYDYEASDINPEYTVENDGTIRTLYTHNKLHKLEIKWFESIGLFKNKHSLSFKLRGGTIFGPEVDNFYNLYVSGITGMKGYPFFALGGGRIASINITYRFPLIENLDFRISPIYFDKLYLGLYTDIGDAWEENKFKISELKKDAGIELRLQAFSFYAFPTSIFFNASYGFDKFTKTFRGENITYGKEWRLYFGILFGFDL